MERTRSIHESTRRRYNHIATTWTHSPRWNYSRIIPEKKASGMISPSAGCREELQIPRSRDNGGAGYRRFHRNLIGSLGFRHRGLLIGEGGRRGGGQGSHTLPRRVLPAKT